MSDPRPLVPGLAALALAIGCQAALAAAPPPDYDVVIRGGSVYDGTGGAPFIGDVALRGDRIAYTGPHAPGRAAEEFSARGKAVAPGFVNMLAHPEESLIVDGRALSDLRQGVTLEVLGENSMGPLIAGDEAPRERQGDIRYAIDWHTLGEYLRMLEQRGIAPNVASYVGAGTVRTAVLGEVDVPPTPAQLEQMRALVHQAMEEGAVGRHDRPDLRAEHLRQDPGARGAGERSGALWRHLQRAHAQRGRPAAGSRAGDDRHLPRLRCAG